MIPRGLSLRLLSGVVAAALSALPARGQVDVLDIRDEASVGSEVERYLRALQVVGQTQAYPWSIRAFSPGEVDRLVPAVADHPWAGRLPPRDSTPVGVLRLLRPRARVTYNTGFPYGMNDGAVWAGRGVTTSVSAGARMRVGALSVRVEPLVFWTENRPFPLMQHRHSDSIPLLDPRSPRSIDLPQRLEEGSFARVDPGQSTARLDTRGFAVGISTANQQWGPSQDQPLVLGPEGPGFPHLFVGTSGPWNVGIGRIHGRLVWGSLSQSAHSPMTHGHGSRRFMSGILGTFLPRGLDGLELGILRFFHDPWPQDGLELSDLARPLEAFMKANLNGRDEPGGPEGVENQLASVFFRWTLPRSGVEVYGEYTREDYNWDLLDAILEPDRKVGFMLGGQKVWSGGGRLLTLRAEWLDTQPNGLNQARRTGHFYRHASLRQGHTVGGQLLGSAAAYGGGGSVVALERHSRVGRWEVDWTRTRIADPSFDSTVEGRPAVPNVMHSVGAEVVFFRGGWDLVANARGTVELNRHFRGDAFNVTAGFGLRAGL